MSDGFILYGYSSDTDVDMYSINKAKSKKHKPLQKIKCCYCEVILTRENFTRDHIIPKHKGGRKTLPCCFSCNQEKGGLMLNSYIEYLVYNLKNLEIIDFPINSKLYKLIKLKIKNAKKILNK